MLYIGQHKDYSHSSSKNYLPSFWCFILGNTKTTRHNYCSCP